MNDWCKRVFRKSLGHKQGESNRVVREAEHGFALLANLRQVEPQDKTICEEVLRVCELGENIAKAQKEKEAQLLSDPNVQYYVNNLKVAYEQQITELTESTVSREHFNKVVSQHENEFDHAKKLGNDANARILRIHRKYSALKKPQKTTVQRMCWIR